MQSTHAELKAWKDISERLCSSAIWQENDDDDASSNFESFDEWRHICERLSLRSIWVSHPTDQPRMSPAFVDSDRSTSAGDSDSDEADGLWGGMSSDDE